MTLKSLLLISLMATSPFSQGADIRSTAPENVGMSGERLGRISQLMQQSVENETIAGSVTLIARKGKIVHFENTGLLNLDTGEPMQKDSLFRIYSMTKPITSVAAMLLFEQGKFQLDDPIAKYLPAFKNQKVLIDGALVDVTHAITIRELMSHTAGLTYGIFGNSAIDQQYRAAMFGEDYQFDFSNTTINADASKIKTLDDLVNAIGPIPLQYQPGTQWVYSLSVDVLGAVIEKISGQTFGSIFATGNFCPAADGRHFF